MRSLDIHPYSGVGEIAFGMTPADVRSRWGSPIRTGRQSGAELEDVWGDVIVRYSVDSPCVVEFAFVPPSPVVLNGREVFRQVDPIAFMIQLDPQPFECLGFIVFLGLGVTITGFHDDNAAQRAVTTFARGRWDVMNEKLVPWRSPRL